MVGGINEDNWLERRTHSIEYNKIRIPLHSPYLLSNNEIRIFKKFFNEYMRNFSNINRELPFVNAIRRLSSSIQKISLEEKIIDLMISLESLFSDGAHEMTFKISVRMSFLLGRNIQETKFLNKFIKEAYALRSQIVHGNKIKRMRIDGKNLTLLTTANLLEG